MNHMSWTAESSEARKLHLHLHPREEPWAKVPVKDRVQMVAGEQGQVLTGHSPMETVTLTIANRMAVAILDLRCMLESDDPHGDRIEMNDPTQDYLRDLQWIFQPMMLERNEIVQMDTGQDQETLIVVHHQESDPVRL